MIAEFEYIELIKDQIKMLEDKDNHRKFTKEFIEARLSYLYPLLEHLVFLNGFPKEIKIEHLKN